MKSMKKMLAIVMVFAMAFAGAFIILGDEDVEAATVTSVPSGAITEDTVVNITSTITDPISLTTESTSVKTVTINYVLSTADTPMIKETTISVGNNIKLVLNMTSDVAVHCNMIVNTSITISGNGEVVFKESDVISGQSWWNNNGTATLTMTDTSKLTLDGANGFSGIAADLDDSSSIVAKNNVNKSSMTFKGLNVESGSSIIISDGDSEKMFISIYDATNVIAGTLDAGSSAIKIMGAEANITATGGKITAAQVIPYNNSGTVTLNITGGAITTKFLNNGDAIPTINLSGSTINKTTTVGEGVTVAFSNDATIAQNATLNVQGAVSGTVINNGTLAVQNSSTDATSRLTIDYNSVGSIDTSAISEDAYLGGTIDRTSTNTTFGLGQVVHIVDNLVIKNGATITINGTLEVPEGMTITIEDGGKLIVSGVTAAINNDGEIIVESGIATDGAFQITNATLNNNGVIIAAYEGDTSSAIAIKFDGVVNNNGTITVNDETNNQIYIDGKFVNKGILENYGSLTIDSTAIINNYDKIIVDGKYTNSGNVSIKVGSVDSEINVISVYGGAFIVDDSIITKADSKNDVDNTEANKITISPNEDYAVTGITITETISTVKEASGTSYFKNMVLAGTVETDYVGSGTAIEGSNVVIEVTLGKNVLVTDALVLSKDVNMAIVSGKELHVSGEMTVADGAFDSVSAVPSPSAGNPVKIASAGNAGTIIVTGKITADKNEIGGTGNVYAASYKVVVTSPASTTYYYTTLEAAIESNAKAIDVNGVITVSKDITVPAGVVVTQETGTLTISKDATITVSDGGKLTQKGGSSIDVNGTLYIEVKKTGLKTASNDSITSEVISEGEKDIRYTNLASAIAAAGSSNIVIKLSGTVEINSDMTIPSNVTINTDGNTFKVKGSKLTIDGTLYLKDDSSKFDIEDDISPLLKEASVVVNGYIVSTDSIVYNGEEFPAGAYYSTKADNVTYNVVTAVENAPAILSTAIDQEIEICGKNKVGDLSFTGSDNGTIYIKGDLTAGKITIDNTTIVLSAGKKITATIANGDNSIAMVDTIIGNTDAQIASTVDSDDVKHFTVSGPIGVQDGKDASYNLGISGTVEAANLTLSALSDSKYYSIVIDGVLLITENSTLGDVLVNGTLIVDNGKTASATDITVFGTIDAKVATADEPVPGTVTVSTIYAGLFASDVKYTVPTSAAAPVLNGAIGATTAFIIDGTVVPESISKATGVKSTQFIVEDSAWMIIYTTDSSMVIGGVSSAPLTDAVLGITIGEVTTKWLKNDKKTSADSAKIGADKCDKVYANVDYYIYDVEIVGDAGVGSIAIDGVVLIKGAGSDGENVFSLPSGTELKAGTHTVTFVLKDGFEGTPVLYKDGTSLGGLTFTLSGTKVTDFTYNLSGTKAVDPTTPVTPVEPTPTPSEKDDSMGITEYLLIVLVILAAILVVVVAIRMMRS